MSAERNVLACVLGEAISLNQLDLEPDDFTEREMHSRLYALMLQRWRKGLPVGVVSVCDSILKENIEGFDVNYIASLCDIGAIGVGIERYVLEMRQASQRRKLIGKLRVISQDLEQGKTDAYQASVEMVGAASSIEDLGTTSMNEAADALIDDLGAVAEGKRLAYVPTGMPEWDEDPNFMGVSRQGVTLMLGRSGMGKTSVINCMAMGMLRKGLKVYVHGTETSIERRLQDMAFSLAAVDGRKWALLTKELSEIKASGDNDLDIAADVSCWYDRIAEQVEWLRAKPLTITGTGMTVEQVCTKARQLHSQGRLDCIFIDYLQTLKDSSGLGVRLGDNVQQTSHKSGMLCQLAADLGVPLVVTGQVSGEKEGRTPGPPQMWDLQHSSRGHQDAESVLAIHRPDYFRERDPHADVKGPRNTVQIYARKRRTGAVGGVVLDLPWHGPTKWVGDRRRVEFAAPGSARLRVVD